MSLDVAPSAAQPDTVEGLRARLAEAEAQVARAKDLIALSRQLGELKSTDEALEWLLGVLVTKTKADRGTLFLNDAQTGELHSRVLVGKYRREIRILNNQGIAGHVFTTGESTLVENAYDDPRFDGAVDEKSGYRTETVLCVPMSTTSGEVIGVAQLLNKKGGPFDNEDKLLVEELTQHCSVTLATRQVVERMSQKRQQEIELLDVISDITAEIKLTSLLDKVMKEASRMLKADRGTLFLNDEKTGELYTEIGQGLETKQIRFPNHLGIAGAVFTSSKSVNIPYAYADLKFNPGFDRQTGYFTRSILCVPVVNKTGKVIGVTQMLNKLGGAFTLEDETRLRAFTAQIAIALENAKLFDDVQNIKNYNESILQSMTNGVVTFDNEGTINTCNAAADRILRQRDASAVGKKAADVFSGQDWLLERIERVSERGAAEVVMDADLQVEDGVVSVNATVQPLRDIQGDPLGTMVMLEDISGEKRVRATMSRYIDAGLADQLLEDGQDVLGGRSIEATVLFSDIRSFTTITEHLGAQGTVSLLNEYFTIMVDCIQRERGMLDKFIGDAIMAGFGVPIAGDDDEDRSVRCAIQMLRELRQWNAARAARSEPPVKIGVGIATGDVVSGNIGSSRRMDYTMIGDTVNLGSRIEGACKAYSAELLIAETTRRKLRGTYRIREVDFVQVKGKTEPVAIYEVLDHHTEQSFPNVMEVVGHFDAGVAHYRARRWKKAREAFERVLRMHPEDGLCKMYLERVAYFAENDPGEGWNGIWVMDSK